MKKIINNPEQFVDEVLKGILLAHSDQLRSANSDARVIVRADAAGPRVGIVTGGGSGHLPVFLGYVGKGLCSGVAVGNVFSSPSSEQIFNASVEVNGGMGVLYLFGNYGGDVLNFELAADLCELEDIETATVLVSDDVMSAPQERADSRRGVAGMVFAFKCAGASAERGDSLAQVAEVARKVVRNTRSAGVGLSPTILPAAGKATFELPEGMMEIGIGIHGEPGIHRGEIESADAITTRLLTPILEDLGAKSGEKFAVLINGLGATPLEELYLMFSKTHQTMKELGLEISVKFIGEYATSLEMSGASITIMRLDDELEELLKSPASSPFFQV
jgi:dihydroxyacetone kinase/dihydroxyacetone kinase-like protein